MQMACPSKFISSSCGTNENPCTKVTKKRPQQQKTPVEIQWFCLGLKTTFCKNVHRARARVTRRGPPGSTIIILKEVIRFNNNNNNNNNHYPPIPWDGFSRQGAPPGEGLPPPLRGGIHNQRVSCSPHTQLSRPMS